MADIKLYWALVAEQRARLLNLLEVSTAGMSREEIAHLAGRDDTKGGGAIFITSVDKPLEGITGGSISGVTVEIAARRIVEGSHRLATKDEIASFKAAQRARERTCADTERRKREADGKTVTIDREVVETLGAAVERASTARARNAGAESKG